MRLIDADGLKKSVKEFRDDAPYSSVRWYVCNVILSMLGDENQTPTIEAAPVRHGRWYWKPIDERTSERTCSVCGQGACDDFNYCPNCGAKMDGGKHD